MASAGISETSTVLDHNPESLEFLDESEPEYQQESVSLEASTQTEKTEVESVFLEAHFYYLAKVFKFGAFFVHGRALGRMSPSST